MVSRRRIIVGASVALWAIAAVGGMTMLMASTRRPDPAADERPVWPAGLSVPRTQSSSSVATVVVCLHPRCPCSDATLDALETLLTQSHNTTAYAIFAIPDHAPAGWADADAVQRAKRIAGLTVVLDAGGRQCSAFGAKTSGQAFLYDTEGRLTFAGGLTPGRGESGASVGAAFVAGVLSGTTPLPPATVHSAVFGCALYHVPPEGQP